MFQKLEDFRKNCFRQKLSETEIRIQHSLKGDKDVD